MQGTSFPYSYWTKILGMIIIVAGVISFFRQYLGKGVWDVNELAIGLSWGFVFIFFSKEKTDDEMIHGLKFRALTRAVIIAFSATHLFNYIFLNWHFNRGRDMIHSISAYQFLALTLIIATISFHYLKHQATSNEER